MIEGETYGEAFWRDVQERAARLKAIQITNDCLICERDILGHTEKELLDCSTELDQRLAFYLDLPPDAT